MAEIVARRRRLLLREYRAVVVAGLGALALVVIDPASADPLPWTETQGQIAKGTGAPSPPTAELQLTHPVPAGLRDGRCRPELFDGSAVGGLVGTAPRKFTGSQFGPAKDTLSATAIGILIEAAVGSHAGSGIARSQEVCFSQSFEHIADRETIAWMDPVEGVHYAVTPTRTVKDAEGRYCREYTARATMNGQAAGIFGTACRRPDGNWELIN